MDDDDFGNEDFDDEELTRDEEDTCEDLDEEDINDELDAERAVYLGAVYLDDLEDKLFDEGYI